MSNPESLTDRLLAHASLCQRMATETFNDEIARELRKLAAECARAAREMNGESGTAASLH